MSSVLIVEGPGDKELFLNIFAGFGKNIEVDPPKMRGSVNGNGISNVMKTLPFDLEKAKSGAIKKIGVVVDADHAGINGGFVARRNDILQVLDDFDYDISAAGPAAQNTGEIFPHKNGLEPFGLWIMPDHFSDGSLEDFLAPLITDVVQQQIWTYGLGSLGALPPALRIYNPVCHRSKAELATWLAMQKPPGILPDLAFKTGLFNQLQPNFLAFRDWVNAVF